MAKSIEDQPLFVETTLAQLVADTSPEAVSAIIAAMQPDLERLLELTLQPTADNATVRALREQAHLCKSAAGYTGLEQLQALCQAFEAACDHADHSTLSSLQQIAPGLIANSRECLANWLDAS